MNWLGLATLIGNIIDKILPDTEAANKAKAELLKLELEGELDNMAKQIEVNQNEARHSSLFVAGWRPFIGWVCGVSFAYHYLVVPTVVFFGGIPLPSFDMQSLLTVLLGMLGLGGMRSFEKMKGVSRKNMKE